MKTRAFLLTFVAVFALAIVSCTENIDESNRYVFKERTIMDYLKQHEDPEKVYYLRFKACLDLPERYIIFDYLEYCSKEVYDNPNTPEDVW